MLYLFALVLPPVGMLLCGKLIQALLCLLLMLTIIGWPVAAIWAVLVVHDHRAEKRTKRLIQAMRQRA